jgi:hypothetical protein
MKFIVHTDTSTFFDLDNNVCVVNTDAMTDEEIEAFIEGWDSEIREISNRLGRPLSSEDL